MPQNNICLAMDLGGTKLELAIVDSDAKILALRKEFLHLEHGKDAVIEQMAQWGLEMIRDFPKVKSVGVSSCGPLDPVKGLLIDATNLLTNGKGWGTVPLRNLLQEKLGLPTFLDNDAACCALAEQWLGVGKFEKSENFMVLTLGTGLGTGIICNNQLFRSGRNRHPEGGHIIVSYDPSAPLCSCGVRGCGESFLSGMHFEKNFNVKYKQSLSAKEIVNLARSGNADALEAFREYSHIMAITLHNYCVVFCPEWFVFGGSFADAFDLFAPAVQSELEKLLVRRKDIVPQMRVSKLENHSCLLGAASLCF